jgi:hypothetical protein
MTDDILELLPCSLLFMVVNATLQAREIVVQ